MWLELRRQKVSQMAQHASEIHVLLELDRHEKLFLSSVNGDHNSSKSL